MVIFLKKQVLKLILIYIQLINRQPLAAKSRRSDTADMLSPLNTWTYYLMDLAYQPKNGHSCCVASWENDVTLMSLFGC